MKSYSQFGEDLILHNEFFPNVEKGICIEVGAVDGIMMSNTLFFEERGWLSICVEANPFMFEDLKKNRSETIHGAVGEVNKNEVDFWIVTLNKQGGNQSAISGLELDQRLLRDHSHLEPTGVLVNVPMYTLNTILERYPHIPSVDFVSIDTEGTELNVLKGFDLVKYNPKVLLIENNYNDTDVEEYLKDFGYIKVKRNFVNDFYIKK